jgi:hypothetical protein
MLVHATQKWLWISLSSIPVDAYVVMDGPSAHVLNSNGFGCKTTTPILFREQKMHGALSPYPLYACIFMLCYFTIFVLHKYYCIHRRRVNKVLRKT